MTRPAAPSREGRAAAGRGAGRRAPGASRLATALLVAHLAGGAPEATAQQLSPSEPAFWIGSGALLAGAWVLDPELRREPPADRVGLSGRLARVGDEIAVRRNVVPALFATIVFAELADWPADSERFVRLAAGVVTAQLATSALKHAVGRGRPRHIGEPRRFRPFTSDPDWHALPSGHAASAFSLAAGLATEFDLPLAAESLAYALATLSAWSRVYDDAHWTSDVVAGAVVGVVGARTTIWRLQRRAEREEETAAALAVPVPIVLIRVPVGGR